MTGRRIVKLYFSLACDKVLYIRYWHRNNTLIIIIIQLSIDTICIQLLVSIHDAYLLLLSKALTVCLGR